MTDTTAPNWYVYILRCADNTLYTGITNDIDRRVQEHNSDGKLGARYTRVRRPVTLVYDEIVGNRSLATRREAAIRKLTRTQKEQLISQVNR